MGGFPKLTTRFFLLFLILFSFPLLIHAENSLTLYIIPPPKKISWESPSAAVWSAFFSDIKSNYHSIGHVTPHLKCDAWNGLPAVNELTGATSVDSIEKDMLTKQGTGMGILFYDFLGRLQTYDEIWKDLQKGKEMENRLSTVRFLVNPSACHRMKEYLDGYREQRLGEHYGLYLRPRNREGAGCTAYAASYLDVAGILTPEIKKAWSKTVLIQESLIGRPVTDRFVDINTLLFGAEAKRWAKESEKHRKLFFYDTQFMMTWLKKIWDLGPSHFPKGYSKDEYNYKLWHQKIFVTIPAPGTETGTEDVYVSNGVMSLLVDFRNAATPTEPIWID